MPELVAIWLSGLVLLLVLFALIAALLRYTRSGRAQQMPLSDVLKVLAVSIGLVCAAYTVLTLLS
jgi:hypothetical protein